MKLLLVFSVVLALIASPVVGEAVHTVVAGETLYSIARRYGVPLADLMADNGITQEMVSRVKVGTRLRIREDARPPAPTVATVDYVVRKDDTFWSVSRAHGISVAELKALNPDVDPERLRVGAKLKVPASAAAGESAAPTTRPGGAATAVTAPTGASTAVTPPPLTALPRVAGTEGELWPHPGARTPASDKHFQHTAIAAKAGDPVVAVASGYVRWVAPFQTYANIIIIEARAGGSAQPYQFWYAGVDDVYVRAGEWVSKGATIARVATNGIDAKPRVAFGVYQGLTPFDHTRTVWQ